MNKQDLMDLELDTPINYSMFKNLLYKGKDERHVLMEDSKGDKKRVYIELFLKYGSVIK